MTRTLCIGLLAIVTTVALGDFNPFDYVIAREISFRMANPESIPEDYVDQVFPVGNERVSVDISLDDGQTWPHNVAYGIMPDVGTNTIPWHFRVTPERWTETARIRVRTLWENAGGNTNAPSFHGGIISDRFSICGIRITEPAHGASVAVPTHLPISFQQAGPEYVDIGISTDGVEFEPLASLAVPGAGIHEYEIPLAADVPHGDLYIAVAASDMPGLHHVIKLNITGW